MQKENFIIYIQYEIICICVLNKCILNDASVVAYDMLFCGNNSFFFQTYVYIIEKFVINKITLWRCECNLCAHQCGEL